LGEDIDVDGKSRIVDQPKDSLQRKPFIRIRERGAVYVVIAFEQCDTLLSIVTDQRAKAR
jgi:hypothetical protein